MVQNNIKVSLYHILLIHLTDLWSTFIQFTLQNAVVFPPFLFACLFLLSCWIKLVEAGWVDNGENSMLSCEWSRTENGADSLALRFIFWDFPLRLSVKKTTQKPTFNFTYNSVAPFKMIFLCINKIMLLIPPI